MGDIKTQTGDFQGEITEDRRLEVYLRDGGFCQRPFCKNSGDHVHHRIFRSAGGSDSPENLVLLCNEHHREAHSQREWQVFWLNWKPKNYKTIL